MMAKKETGLQFLARLGSRPSLEGLQPVLFGSGPQGKDVIEVYGADGTGKSELLLHLISRIILPEEWKAIRLGGHGAGIVFIDTDYKLSILRLAAVLEKLILQKVESQPNMKTGHKNNSNKNEGAGDVKQADMQAIDPNELEEFIKQCLKKLYVVRCENSAQFMISLHNLENVISNDPSISAIMIDSISAFYWLDRFIGDNTASQETNMKCIANSVEKLVNTYNLTLFATKATIFKKKMDPGFSGKEFQEEVLPVVFSLQSNLEQTHAEFMCKAWQSLVTHRLVLVSVPEAGNHQSSKYIVGGDCAQGNRHFTINEAGIQFVEY